MHTAARSGSAARLKALVVQCAVAALFVLGFVVIVRTTLANLDRLGIGSGFDFLAQRAGFNINQALIEYHPGSTVARAFAVAVLNSLALALVCAGFATALGVVIGAARLSSNWLAARLAALYVEVFRNVPALLQVFFWYYVVLRMLPGPRAAIAVFDLAFLSNRGLYLPAPRFGTGGLLALGAIAGAALLILRRGSGTHCAHRVRGLRGLAWVLAIGGIAGLGLTASWDVPHLGRYTHAGGARLLPEFLAVALGLSFYNAAYIAEITRGGIQSVPAGQREAALSLGLDAIRTLRFVVLPQALRVMLPPLASIYVNLFKASSIGAAVGYPEVVSVMVGTTNNLVGRPVEIMALTLAVYASVSLVAAGLMNRYHARLERDPEMRQ